MTRTMLLPLSILGLLLFVSHAVANDTILAIITTLDKQIETSDSNKQKAKLCCFRARNYTKIKNFDESEQSYLEALDYSYTGWILNEYCHYLYRTGEYERAYRAALKIEEDFPQFSREAFLIKKKAKAKYQEEYYETHPPTIIMDTEVDTNRLSRHDLIRKYGSSKTAPILHRTKLSKTSSTTTSTSSTKKSSSPRRT